MLGGWSDAFKEPQHTLTITVSLIEKFHEETRGSCIWLLSNGVAVEVAGTG